MPHSVCDDENVIRFGEERHQIPKRVVKFIAGEKKKQAKRLLKLSPTLKTTTTTKITQNIKCLKAKGYEETLFGINCAMSLVPN